MANYFWIGQLGEKGAEIEELGTTKPCETIEKLEQMCKAIHDAGLILI